MCDSFLFLVKIDLMKKIQQNKNYFIDYFLSEATDIFFLLGIIFVEYNTNHNNNRIVLDKYFIFRIFMWFILTGVIGKIISEVEREIRMDYLRNILHHKCSFTDIFLSRVISTCIEIIPVVLIPVLLVLFVSDMNFTLFSFQTLLYFILILVITVFLSYLFLLVVLHVKRIMAAHGLFSNYLLFFSGLVFLDSKNKIGLFRRLNFFLFNNINLLYLSIFFIFIIILILGIVFLQKKISLKIHML